MYYSQEDLEKVFPGVTFKGKAMVSVGVKIGKGTVIGDRVLIGRQSIISEGVVILDDTRLGYRTLIGKGAIIGSDVIIAGSCSIESFTTISNGCNIGNGSTIGKCNIPQNSKVRPGSAIARRGRGDLECYVCFDDAGYVCSDTLEAC